MKGEKILSAFLININWLLILSLVIVAVLETQKSEKFLSEFLTNINWLLIIFSLIIGSAILSVLGDSVGSKYGKKRISLFGLRPKRTSQLITALTGGLIAVGAVLETQKVKKFCRHS